MRETLSAWMDGELGDEHAAPLLPQIKRDAQLRRDWDCYHLIGDALRGGHGADLCAGVHARLEAEPTVLAPQRASKRERPYWTALSVAASLAAVAFVGWMALPGTQQDALPVAALPAPAAVQQAAVPAGDGAKDYLLAHQRYSPSSAMQGVASYVRTVAEERNSARR